MHIFLRKKLEKKGVFVSQFFFKPYTHAVRIVRTHVCIVRTHVCIVYTHDKKMSFFFFISGKGRLVFCAK